MAYLGLDGAPRFGDHLAMSALHHDLEPLGISAEQAAVYEHLLTKRAMTSDELALHSGDLEGSLQALLQLGLITSVRSEQPRWTAVPPDLALDSLIAAREQRAAEARLRVMDLAARYHGSGSGRRRLESAEVVHGRPELLAQSEILQREAKSLVCFVDRPPYVDETSTGVNELEVELLGRGIEYRTIYHAKALDYPNRLETIQQEQAAGEQVRLADVPMRVILSDRPMALLPLQRDAHEFTSALVIHDEVLVEAMAAVFDSFWRRAIPLRLRNGAAQVTNPDDPTAEERTLLSLLVAGKTDREIAGYLGCAPRTIRRRVHDLAGRLHAETRFQAGYQAVQWGWLEP